MPDIASQPKQLSLSDDEFSLFRNLIYDKADENFMPDSVIVRNHEICSSLDFSDSNVNWRTFKDLCKLGADEKQNMLAGKTFVLTGALETMTRDEAKKRIEAVGGKVSGSVSRNTDYLVVGASPGSKLKRAEELGVEIIDENKLKGLIADGG